MIRKFLNWLAERQRRSGQQLILAEAELYAGRRLLDAHKRNNDRSKVRLVELRAGNLGLNRISEIEKEMIADDMFLEEVRAHRDQARKRAQDSSK